VPKPQEQYTMTGRRDVHMRIMNNAPVEEEAPPEVAAEAEGPAEEGEQAAEEQQEQAAPAAEQGMIQILAAPEPGASPEPSPEEIPPPPEALPPPEAPAGAPPPVPGFVVATTDDAGRATAAPAPAAAGAQDDGMVTKRVVVEVKYPKWQPGVTDHQRAEEERQMHTAAYARPQFSTQPPPPPPPPPAVQNARVAMPPVQVEVQAGGAAPPLGMSFVLPAGGSAPEQQAAPGPAGDSLEPKVFDPEDPAPFQTGQPAATAPAASFARAGVPAGMALVVPQAAQPPQSLPAGMSVMLPFGAGSGATVPSVMPGSGPLPGEGTASGGAPSGSYEGAPWGGAPLGSVSSSAAMPQLQGGVPGGAPSDVQPPPGEIASAEAEAGEPDATLVTPAVPQAAGAPQQGQPSVVVRAPLGAAVKVVRSGDAPAPARGIPALKPLEFFDAEAARAKAGVFRHWDGSTMKVLNVLPEGAGAAVDLDPHNWRPAAAVQAAPAPGGFAEAPVQASEGVHAAALAKGNFKAADRGEVQYQNYGDVAGAVGEPPAPLPVAPPGGAPQLVTADPFHLRGGGDDTGAARAAEPPAGASAAAPAAAHDEAMDVAVPAGVQPGGVFDAQIPGGGEMAVTVPAGMAAGQEVQIEVPEAK
jgi:hypothetical protein